MPDALELLKTRKSISAQFLGLPGPDRQQLDEMLTIASRVPDHGKLVPWRFIVFEGDARALDVSLPVHLGAELQELPDLSGLLGECPDVRIPVRFNSGWGVYCHAREVADVVFLDGQERAPVSHSQDAEDAVK